MYQIWYVEYGCFNKISKKKKLNTAHRNGLTMWKSPQLYVTSFVLGLKNPEPMHCHVYRYFFQISINNLFLFYWLAKKNLYL